MTAASSTPALAIAHVVKDYRGLRPLRLAALTVREGERVSLAGFDRASAEIFINLINGAVLPDTGEVRVFGQRTADIEHEAEWLSTLDRFGIVTERSILLEGSTVAQNLTLPFHLDIEEIPADVMATVTALAEETELGGERLHRPAAHAGPAIRVRVHLARALATSPRLLLMEHPTASLPREDVAPFADLVRTVVSARGLTLVALNEDEEFAARACETSVKLQPATGAFVSTRGWRRFFR